jgi:tetratricopeptide (TPR) repeat protein
MKIVKYLFLLSILGFLLFSVYVNYITFKSLVFQNELRSDPERKILYDSVINRYPEIPNIEFATLPIAATKAIYAINEYRFKEADSLIQIADSINPYTFVGDYLKGKLFLAGELFEPAMTYSKKAFYGWPKAKDHYKVYNDVLVHYKDTLEISAAYSYLDEYLKKDPFYQDVFYNSLNAAKFRHLITSYPDTIPLTKELLIGKWVRAYNFPNQSIKDTLYTYEFLQRTFVNPSKETYSYKLKKDSLLVYLQKDLTKPIVSYKSLYSKEHQTLIFFNIETSEGVIQDQYFLKCN